MQIFEYPPREEWKQLLKRPIFDTRELGETVRTILDDVRANGDEALFRYSRKFDGADLDRLAVSEEEFRDAESKVSQELKDALDVAKANIEAFHRITITDPRRIETMPGVECWKETRPIEKVGLYIPGGTAPLFSTVLMLANPAVIAGCSEIVMCSPPGADGSINVATLYAARLCGVTKVFKVGGSQAIAAMAFGTESVPQVFKIFGPGNQYVTEAKLQALRYGVSIDMPAGPSEVAVLADESCVPKFVAADLLSQAEHGVDSQVILISTSKEVTTSILTEVQQQVELLPRKVIADTALANSKAIIVDSLETGIEMLNEYAPEHLIVVTHNPEEIARSVINAGSVFLGNYSCESAGDYASGTNHTLPTNGSARSYSGVSVESFTKTITFQRLTEDGIRNLGPAVEIMAAAEGLSAHERAMSTRREFVGGRNAD
jgi:histidinol dehydrogenase